MRQEAKKCNDNENMQVSLKDSNRPENDGSYSEDGKPPGDAPKAPKKLDHDQNPGGSAKKVDHVELEEGYFEYPIGGLEKEKTYFFKKGIHHMGYWLKSQDKKNRTAKYKRYMSSFFRQFQVEPVSNSLPRITMVARALIHASFYIPLLFF